MPKLLSILLFSFPDYCSEKERKSSTGRVAGLKHLLPLLQEEADHSAVIHLWRRELVLPCSSGRIHHCFRRLLFTLCWPNYPCNLAVTQHIPHLNQNRVWKWSTSFPRVNTIVILFMILEVIFQWSWPYPISC